MAWVMHMSHTTKWLDMELVPRWTAYSSRKKPGQRLELGLGLMPWAPPSADELAVKPCTDITVLMIPLSCQSKSGGEGM
jgi:hypothetical protein